MRMILCWVGMMAVASSCDPKVPIDEIEEAPAVTSADSAYANIFRKLDGTWTGTFFIYRDSLPGPRRSGQLEPPNPDFRDLPGVYLSDSLIVTQMYASETPFFQTVTIKDYYPESGKTVVSQGVNKVQDGRLWCVVRKPEETVIHRGTPLSERTLIWSRDEIDPQKVEYFRETVSDSLYTILGWGYYEGDDPQKMPPFWFSATYRRTD